MHPVLQDGEESGVLNVSAAFNSLNLVMRDEGLMKFIKVHAELAGVQGMAALAVCG